MTQTGERPSKGAFLAACTMGRERPELQRSTAWGTDECMVAAHIIDREAVAPAIRELVKRSLAVLTAIDYIASSVPIATDAPVFAELRAEAGKYRHLLHDSEKGVR